MSTLTARGQATRARIVEAAAELIFRQGVAGTSIPDVLCAAGVSASQLYHYFADKQDLVRAVIAHQTELGLDAQSHFALDTLESLRAWADATVALQDTRDCHGGCVIGSLVSELADADEVFRTDLLTSLGRWETRLRDGLAVMLEKGVLRPEADVDRLALVVMAALQGGLLLTQLRRDSAPLRVALDAAIAQVEAEATHSG